MAPRPVRRQAGPRWPLRSAASLGEALPGPLQSVRAGTAPGGRGSCEGDSGRHRGVSL